MRILLGALAMAALSQPVLAETWIDIDRTPHVLTAIDTDSAERSGTHVKFWMRQVFDMERRVGVYEGKPMAVANVQGVTHFVEIRSLIDIDCRARTFANPYARFYNREGRLVSQAVMPAGRVAIGPDTILASGADLLCPKA
jgi:hypothetical protein